MKIIGFTYHSLQQPVTEVPSAVAPGTDAVDMVLKCDSSLLNGRKPMFIPDWTNDLRYTPAVALRICRVGKNIQPRFAGRYYDAVAPAIDFCAYDTLLSAQRAGRSDTTARAFDFSFAIGTFLSLQAGDAVAGAAPFPLFRWSQETAAGAASEIDATGLLLSPEEAIHRASRVMTLRQGDILYIPYSLLSTQVSANDVLHAYCDTDEVLYCKIK